MKLYIFAACNCSVLITMMDRSIIRVILCLTVLCACGKASGQRFVCTRALDIAIAVDVSGSLSSNFSQIQTFLDELMGQFDITNKQRIVVYGFDDMPRFSNVISFDQAGAQSLAGVREQISNINQTLGATFITVAIAEASRLFNESTVRNNAERVAVFVTDGVHQGGSRFITKPAAELRANFNARVIGLGVSSSQDTNDINTNAFGLLTGDLKNLLILEFERRRCPTGGGGGGGSDSEDDDDDDGESDEEDSDSDNGGGAACDDELSRAARLICG